MRKGGVERKVKRKKTIQMFAVMAALFSMIGLSACGQSGHNVALFQYKSGDTFISEMMEHIIAQMPDGITFEVHDAGNSQSVQNRQIVEMIEREVDILIVNAVDRLACSAIVARSAQAEIPVIFFNREPLDDAIVGRQNVFYVGTDPDNLGRKQAEMVADLFTAYFAGSHFDRNDDGIIQVVILKGEQGHQDAERRTETSIARLIELGFEVEVLAIEVADWNRSDGYEAMRSLFERYGDRIELVFSNNDDMALGAIDFLLNARIFRENRSVYEQPFVIVGVDGTAVGLEAIERGLLYGTVNNDSVKQSDAILMLIDFILNNKDFNHFPYTITRGHFIYIDGDIITKANLADFMQ